MVDLRYVIDYLAYNGIFYLVNERGRRRRLPHAPA